MKQRLSTSRRRFIGAAVALGVAAPWMSRAAAQTRKQRNYFDTTWWDPYVESITDSDTYLRRKFRQDVTDKATGLSAESLKKVLAEIVASGKASGESWRVTKAKCFAAQVERQSIDVSPLDWFPAIAVWDRWNRPISGIIGRRAREVNDQVLSDRVRSEWQRGTVMVRGTCGRTSTTPFLTGA